MDTVFFSQINDKLKASLDDYRYAHTLGVAGTAASLAMKWSADTDKAELAGLLHDCAKCIPNDEKYRLCEEGSVSLNSFELKNPALVHAKLGAYIARRDYGVDDPEILDAIRTHTTGSPGMTLLQKIIYTADLIEPNRDDRIPDIGDTRRIAFEDLDEAVYLIVKRSIEYLEKNGLEIDTESVDTYRFYKEIHDRKRMGMYTVSEEA